MDVNAWNYNPLANVNNGHDSLGCLYAAEQCVNGSGNPFFLNDPCYAWVIEVDEYCCYNEWDTICQLTYNHCADGWTGNLPPARFSQDKISIYPNPTNDYVYIDKEVDFEVYNSIGVLISKKRGSFVDLSSYSTGIYNIITIFKDNKQNHKIIKQ